MTNALDAADTIIEEAITPVIVKGKKKKKETELVVPAPASPLLAEKHQLKQDVVTDYKYARSNLYNLIEKTNTALEGILEVAGLANEPRAYEVVGTLIGVGGELTDRLTTLHKNMEALLEKEQSQNKSQENTGDVTNIFMTPADLLKEIKHLKEEEDK